MIKLLNKNIFSIVLTIAVITLFAMYFIHPGIGKIAYIETNALLPKYEGFKKAQIEYQQKVAQWKANSDTLAKKWQNELKAYEKERSSLSVKERELKEQLLSNKQQQISNYKQSIDKKAKEEEEKMMQTIYSELNDFVTEYGKKKGYQYILGANGTGNVLYADKAVNITDIILEGINKEYSKKNK